MSIAKKKAPAPKTEGGKVLRVPVDEDMPEVDLRDPRSKVLGRGLRAGRPAHLTLRGLRESVGKTQAELAQALGIEQSEVSRIERRRNVELVTLRRFAEALGARCEVAFVFRKTGHRIFVAEPGESEPRAR
jgi:DNA-binding XRE family transcriptional regulator